MKKILLMFLVLILGNAMVAQNKEPNDCVNAIVVCGSGTFSSNANGPGDNAFEVAGCGGHGGEHNSLWLKITIAATVQPGSTLGFDLIPDDTSLSADYDFWVYGPNKPCSALGPAIRCNATNNQQANLLDNHTGLNGSTNATTAWSGPGGNGLPYVRWLNVNPGEYYYIAIDRPYATGGFKLNWTGTAMNGAGAFPAQPAANQIADLVTCSLTPNVGIFNLNGASSQISPDLINNTVTVAYYTSLSGAIDGVAPPLPGVYANTSNPQPIFARVTDKLGGCFNTTSFNLRVFEIPTASFSPLPKSPVCAGESVTVTITGTPGATVDYNIDGGAQSGLLDIATGTFVLTETLTTDRTYAITRAKILDGTGKEVCFTDYTVPPDGPPVPVIVKVNPQPTITGTLTICQGDTSQLTGSGTPDPNTPWTSSNTTFATVDSSGLVTGVAVGTSNITYTDINGCSATSAVTIGAMPTISGKSPICASGSTQLTGSGTPATSNAWTSSDPSIATVTSTGFVNGVAIGSVTITYIDINGCSAVFNLDVTAASTTQTATAEVSNFFDDNQTITVTVVGDAAVYLYSLDAGPFQTSNVFSNVMPGLHYVTVNDTQGCTNLVIENILTIGYPHFFTPNNDGYNDTWNVTALTEIQPDAEIFIFDRYGKLLKRITPGGAGWDGTYNGQPMPSNDYWFTIKYLENGTMKLFKSHFSLKR